MQNVLDLISQLNSQTEAATKANTDQTDLVKSAKALQSAAKMAGNAASYWTLPAEGATENPGLPGYTAEAITQWKEGITALAKNLADSAEILAPDSLFDKSKGVALADQLSLYVKAAEAGFADTDPLSAVAEALTRWSAVKGTSGPSGPRASKGQGGLGYVIQTSRPDWEKPLSDSSGKGSAMSSALGKLGGDQIKGAARATWVAAGKGDEYDNLASAIDQVIKGGVDEVTEGNWTVKAEGRVAAPATEPTSEPTTEPTTTEPVPAAV